MRSIHLYLKIFLLLFISGKVAGQNYNVSLIPDSLKLNSYLVVRDESRVIELRSANSGTEKTTRVMTVFNKSGEDMARLVLYYDKNSSVRVNEITYFDSKGDKIRSVKQSEITDAPTSTSELYSDSRIKYYTPIQAAYPYTVKFIYEYDLKNIISFSPWRPFRNYNVSCQKSTLQVISHRDIKINSKEINFSAGEKLTSGENVGTTWLLTNVKAIEDEPFDISLSERIPCVYLMPSGLDYDNYKGSADSWQNYGKWLSLLYKDRDKISDEEKQKVENLIKDIPDTLNMIKALYKYMQERTRYVAITLGIGGFQPFEASSVYQTGYGDCKALSNYLFSLLKLAGIRSYPALVSSGEYKEKIFADFPNFQQFDHVILCVPMKTDTIWLECTNQKIPFGFLGSFTDDRDVLLVTEAGGVFAHTRRYDANNNVRSCRSEITIDSTGAADCSITTNYKGLQYYNIFDFLNSNPDEQKKWLYSHSYLPSLQISKFKISNVTGNDMPLVNITELESSKNYCTFSGKYMIFPVNVINQQKSIQKMTKTRFSDILIGRSFIDFDTIVFRIPKNYVCETLPSGVDLKTEFGSYNTSLTASAVEIIFTRKCVIREGRFKPATYKEFYDFVLSISRADNSKIMLTRKS